MADHRVLLVGGGGQLGHDLQELLLQQGLTLDAPGSDQLDLLDPEAAGRYVSASGASVIVNCAAWTAVDRAESEPQAALGVNRDGAAALAAAAEAGGIRMLQVSTDFVFSGEARQPYGETDTPGPLNQYGRSKLEGEQAVLSRCRNSLVVRTSWLYGAHGQNFVKTILRLAQSREELTIVSDQQGSPTWTRDLAQALYRLLFRDETGILHYANRGQASWYEFAVAIIEEARMLGFPLQVRTVRPIASSEYPAPARRPAYSVLSCERIARLLPGPVPEWRDSLRAMLEELKQCPDC